MFFDDARRHFFRPLTSKYREQVVECLRALYARLYSSLADYSRAFTRDQVLEVFQEVITRAPVLDEAEDEFGVPVRSEREQAGWVLNLLLEHGWMEKNVDGATLHSTYAFSRSGRLFTQALVEVSGGRFRTRHRNTRNTRNALQSFLEQGEVYDLLDAYEYSERIVSDFSDIIAELDERKRQLVREVEAQQLVQRATDEFFDFMEKRFMPDLAIRLSADSVEKYRDELQELVNKARRKRDKFKADAERNLRKIAGELQDFPKQSIYLKILDGIETRVSNASAVMLPALRHALNSFTRRADIIMRQLSYSGAGHNRLQGICQRLTDLPEADQEKVLASAGEAMAALNVAVPDPDSLRLHAGRRRRVVSTRVEEQHGSDSESRRTLFVQAAVDLAFNFSDRSQRDYVIEALGKGHRLHSQNLPVNNARELLMSAHVVEIGAQRGSSEFRFRVEPTGEVVSTDYFDQSDGFTIELVGSDGFTAEDAEDTEEHVHRAARGRRNAP